MISQQLMWPSGLMTTTCALVSSLTPHRTLLRLVKASHQDGSHSIPRVARRRAAKLYMEAIPLLGHRTKGKQGNLHQSDHRTFKKLGEKDESSFLVYL